MQKGPKTDGYYSTVAISPYTPINLFGVKLSQALSQVNLPLTGSNLRESPNLDLHAYTPDGRHIGMNYTSGEYENQVEGAVASGDLEGGDEWIFVPFGTNVTYAVSSYPTGKFLEAYPQLQSQFQQQSFNLTHICFDQTGRSYVSRFETLTISPNSSRQFLEFHNISVSNVAPSKTSVVQGETVLINVTVINGETEPDTFHVTCYAGNLTVGSQSLALMPTSNTTLTFSWDTANATPSDYTITEKVESASGEIYPSDGELDNCSMPCQRSQR